MNAGLRGLQTILSRGKLEHEDVGALQVVVDYLVLMEVGQARCNLPSKQSELARTNGRLYYYPHCHLRMGGQIVQPHNEVLCWLLNICISE